MIQLFIIADDFTGALDTAVKLTAKGILSRVLVVNGPLDFESQQMKDASVLVVDAETRHLTAKDAYDVVYRIVKEAVRAKIPYIYKKTDSALRGNIGSELAAVLDAANEKKLAFIPAFPKMNRVTKNGIHYIDEVPVHQSVFGIDPFEPVKYSLVKDIIQSQSKVAVVNHYLQQFNQDADAQGIHIYDATTQEDMKKIANYLEERNETYLLAGCAGFAEELPSLLKLERKTSELVAYNKNLLMLCGSVNPITIKQLDQGEAQGYKRIRLTPEEKLETNYWDTKSGQHLLDVLTEELKEEECCIIDSNDKQASGIETIAYGKTHNISLDEIRVLVSQSMAKILKGILERGYKGMILVTGGDTLLAFMKEINVHHLKPLEEIQPGCVLTELHYKNESYQIITKSGGFGQPQLLKDLLNKINDFEN
ncbi:Dihydrodipicolinate synthase [Lachnospiraceae bacterium TWA4]|nr:Dihydrodipicolinate synthase [Lachnospiraceae bacterium TWA4]